jgi:hypothetical protein
LVYDVVVFWKVLRVRVDEEEEVLVYGADVRHHVAFPLTPIFAVHAFELGLLAAFVSEMIAKCGYAVVPFVALETGELTRLAPTAI